MKAIKSIPLWAFILVLLLLGNLGWMSWNWCQNARLRSAKGEFKLIDLHTNNVSGIGIVEMKTGRPLWIQWKDNHDGKPDEESFFFRGTNVFNLFLKEGQPPAYNVIFYGPGKSQVQWWDLRRGTFMTRGFYDTNGDFSKQEDWYANTWYSVDRTNGHNGIIVNGQWHQLAFDTNGMWTTEPEATVSTNQF
jgi:hypothetical protein